MARKEEDREDLMREATALVRRVELRLPGDSQTCLVGFRRGGEASVFVGTDPVFQFNAAGELRRGFWNGRLVKAEGSRLVYLERRRTETEVQLVRQKFTAAQTTEFLQLAMETLNRLRRALHHGDLDILQQVPLELDVVAELTAWLDSVADPLAIASIPNVHS
ncbi:MAG TPA: hypothetical protein VMM76_07985 [Pirellulaceae bacterium]|nr:hypothetical protein [Pirellulaceae bacterium]